MAVAVKVAFRGGTLDQYDSVVRAIGYARGGPGAQGSLFHFVTKTDDGFLVTDVWESRERFEGFAREQILPRVAAFGLSEQPHIEIVDVHNYFTAG